MTNDGSVLLRDGRAMHLDGMPHGAAVDIGIERDGTVGLAGRWDGRRPFDRVLTLNGAWISPAWIDLHVHCYYGGTWLSLRPARVGPARGVGLVVDCGSAGEANFAGFKEFLIDPSPFPILAYLNISTIGLVAANRVSELIGDAVLDPVRTAQVAEAHRGLIKGIKIRASDQVVGEWGMTPVRVAKTVARALGLPLVVHIGEAPPTLDEIFDVLEPGDMITHCFTGKLTNAIDRQPPHFRRMREMVQAGLWIDVGHGQGSFHYGTARFAIAHGLLPTTISTDLHIGNAAGPVWDMPTTMSKMLTVGMTVEDVVARSTTAPARFLGIEGWGGCAAGVPARFTVFDVAAGEEALPDSYGNTETIRRFFEPRHTVLGTTVWEAARDTDRGHGSVSINSGDSAPSAPVPAGRPRG
ncbi:MAG TPA: amidohydrolase/deacetylase family metallohydrolase [bacterium]|nr:amidohydrolase/deacetylase family metallohydrolase [bacterium]